MTEGSRAALACTALMLAACQWVTELDSLEVSSAARDAAADAPDAEALPPLATDGLVPTPCLIPDGAECDLVRQCGCGEGEHCQVRTSERRPTCVAPGANEAWSACRHARECPHGQTCDRGSCRPHCTTDDDCEGGACFVASTSDDSSANDVHVCWRRCEPWREAPPAPGLGCASGTSCLEVRTPVGEKGLFCTALFDPCPSTKDGVCDESRGTGTCADGSDKKDCECMPTLPSAKCDPVSQCGCAPGLTCELVTLADGWTLTAACYPPGTKELYAECSFTSECGPGLTCNLNIGMCVNHCSSSADCLDGACWFLGSRDDPNIGLCTPRCSRSGGTPCPSGVACATITSAWKSLISEPGDYCWKPLSDDCIANGVCDEPRGTGICAPGTDTADCCHPPNGGECNHITGCGCETKPGTQCRAILGIPLCDVEGTDAPWSLCTGLGKNCPPGYGCGDGVCRPYCSVDQSCGEGKCVPYRDFNGKETSSIGGCFMECDFERDGGCPPGLACALTDPPRAFCHLPYAECPSNYIGNGRCDDPRSGGTRTCAMGTDPDCDASHG